MAGRTGQLVAWRSRRSHTAHCQRGCSASRQWPRRSCLRSFLSCSVCCGASRAWPAIARCTRSLAKGLRPPRAAPLCAPSWPFTGTAARSAWRTRCSNPSTSRLGRLCLWTPRTDGVASCRSGVGALLLRSGPTSMRHFLRLDGPQLYESGRLCPNRRWRAARPRPSRHKRAPRSRPSRHKRAPGPRSPRHHQHNRSPPQVSDLALRPEDWPMPVT